MKKQETGSSCFFVSFVLAALCVTALCAGCGRSDASSHGTGEGYGETYRLTQYANCFQGDKGNYHPLLDEEGLYYIGENEAPLPVFLDALAAVEALCGGSRFDASNLVAVWRDENGVADRSVVLDLLEEYLR